jgi:predicted AAA+ superfamily ATPase
LKRKIDYNIHEEHSIMIHRILADRLFPQFFHGKVIIILGPRQSGKTTFMKMIVEQCQEKMLWLNADESDIRQMLTATTSTRLKSIIGSARMIVIDEAQRISDVGLTLKLMVDTIPDIQIMASGSSALELAGIINEPLTGRKIEKYLYPIAFQEMVNHTSLLEEKRLLEQRLIFGYYPEIVTKPGQERELLAELSQSYLYKDIFTLAKVKKPAILEKILQALALQIGSEVHFHELAGLVGADKETVERYIDLLEKTFVIFKLPSLNRNLRNEIKKGRKIYFYDNGIRNAIIKNFNLLSLRSDVGALFENFLVSERLKRNHYQSQWCNIFFWRTMAQQEIDYIEEKDGQLTPFEFKYGRKKRGKMPRSFQDAYDPPELLTISPDNIEDFLLTRS